MAKDIGIVYSTEHGRMCPECGKPAAECVCRKGSVVPPGDGIVRVSRDVKGRRGKTMTVITGVPLDEPGLQKLATELKRRCGAGGTVKEGVIEIQGDHCDLVMAELTKRGYTVKRVGG